MSMAMAKEICSCGANILIDNLPDVSVGYRLSEWRKEHRHEMSITKSVGEVSVTRPWGPEHPSYDEQGQ